MLSNENNSHRMTILYIIINMYICIIFKREKGQLDDVSFLIIK